MEERDFEWCLEHENLFREWWFHINEIIPDSNWWLDNDSFFDCWKMAKQYAYKIANSADPLIRYIYTYREIHKNTPVYVNHLLCFLWTMLMSIKNENLKALVSDFKNCLELDEDSPDAKLLQVSLKWILKKGEKESDYDYSLPDGGITETITKTITKTDTETETKTKMKTDTETETKTKMKTEADETETDETITQTKTKTITKTEENSVDVILPKHNSLNNDDFISAMRKAIEKGLIEIIEKGKYKWKGFEDVKSNFNAALAYFIAKALKIKMELKADKTLTKDSYDDINKKFPENYDIKEVFGLDIQSVQLVKALEAGNIQKWRKAIDDFFDEET